jgi:serine phosphatase RsbU (regulator of sigma subunit)
LLLVLWVPLVGALPIAVLFGTIDWIGWFGYWLGYKIALFFGYPIALCVWLTHTVLAPRGNRPTTRHRRIWLREVLPTTLSALLGALLGARVLEWMQPGIVGDALSVAKLLVFTLFFTALAIAASYAVSFHHDSVQRARTDEELRLARQLQRTMLGDPSPPGLPVDLHAGIIPSRQVSGDFYDVITAADGSFFVAIADVAGARMPAALLAAMLLAALRMQTATGSSVSEIVRSINRLACRGRITEESLFASIFVARFEPRTLQLSFTNAGHRYPVVFRRSGERIPLVRGGTVVGVLESLPYEEDSVTLQPGDRLLLYTDGAIETANPHGEMFGEDRLFALVKSAPAAQQSRELVEHVLASLREFQAGREAIDDVALLILQVPAAGA